MKALLNNVQCSFCKRSLVSKTADVCESCKHIKFDGLSVIVTQIASSNNPSRQPFVPSNPKLPIPPNWRTLCYREIELFIQSRGIRLGSIIDLGSGPLTNSDLLTSEKTLFIDGTLYEGVDVVTDFSQALPLSNACCDTLICSNVLEHMKNPQLLIDEIVRTLKVDGEALILVPFCIKIHQAPLDFFRFTKFGLTALIGSPTRLKIKELGGITNIKKTLLTIEKKHCTNPLENCLIFLQNQLVQLQAMAFGDKVVEEIPQGYALIIKKQ